MTSTQTPTRSEARRLLRLVGVAVSLAVCISLAVATLAGRSEDPQTMIEHARDLTLAGKYDDALTQVHRVLARLGDVPNADLQRRALVRAAQLTDLHLGDHRVNEALGWYRQIIDTFPESVEAFDAGVRISEILKQRFHDDARASEQLVSVVDAFPAHSGAPRLLLRAARLAVEARLYDRARDDAARILSTWPSSDEAADAQALVASTLHLQGRHAEAVVAWEELAERFEGTPAAARALAEAGHCLEEQADFVHAMARYLQSLPQHPEPFAVQKRLERVRRKFVAEQAKQPGSPSVAFR